MAKKLLALLFMSVLTLPLSTLVLVPVAAAQDKAAKEMRWEGTVIQVVEDKSTLTVRNQDKIERTVQSIAERYGSVSITVARRATTLIPARSKTTIL